MLKNEVLLLLQSKIGCDAFQQISVFGLKQVNYAGFCCAG
jgi:hypothetical protein